MMALITRNVDISGADFYLLAPLTEFAALLKSDSSLAVLFIGALAFALTTEYVHAESESASSWQELQSKFDSLDNVTIELSHDCTASETDQCLIVQEGKTITLDLNGHTLDRNLDMSGYHLEEDAIVVYGNLTIIDSGNTGVITGGMGFDGGIRVERGSVTMEGGTITGNWSFSAAGGVSIFDGGCFTMNGGVIEDNYGEGAGGIYVNNGSCVMTGGKITKNSGYFDNGGVHLRRGSFIMTGGEITDNYGESSGYNCSAVQISKYSNANDVFDLRGGTLAGVRVIGIEEDDYTGTIEVNNGTFRLSGNPTIISDGFADVYLADGKTIDVAGALDDSLSLSVKTETKPTEETPVTITSGLMDRGTVSGFTSEEDYAVGETEEGEAVLGIPTLSITYNSGRGSGSDETVDCIRDCMYTLEDCMFTPPEGMSFTGWTGPDGVTVYDPGDIIKLTDDLMFTAGYDCIEHKWETSYTWSEDNSSVTATRVCQVGGEEETETVSVTSKVTIQPGCLKGGVRTWTSGKFGNEAFEVQTKEEDVSSTGHAWGTWKVTKKATALTPGTRQRVCAHDSKHVQKQTIPATGVKGTLMARMTASGSKSLKVTWSKISGAEGYDIFFARCNTGGKEIACKKVKTIKGNKTFKWSKAGLKKQTAYKVYVKAFASKNGKKTYIRTSPVMHAFTSGYDKRYTNAKAVTMKKTAVSLKSGKTYQIKADVTRLKAGKKLMSKGHAAKLRYLSSNNKIASVSKSGRVTARSKGTCTIYVFAHNGISKTLKVTVR